MKKGVKKKRKNKRSLDYKKKPGKCGKKTHVITGSNLQNQTPIQPISKKKSGELEIAKKDTGARMRKQDTNA